MEQQPERWLVKSTQEQEEGVYSRKDGLIKGMFISLAIGRGREKSAHGKMV
jgi:hypothetical protein